MMRESIYEKMALAEDRIVSLAGNHPTLAQIFVILEIARSSHHCALKEQELLRFTKSQRKVFPAFPDHDRDLCSAISELPFGLAPDVSLRPKIEAILQPFKFDEAAQIMRLVSRYIMRAPLRQALRVRS